MEGQTDVQADGYTVSLQYGTTLHMGIPLFLKHQNYTFHRQTDGQTNGQTGD